VTHTKEAEMYSSGTSKQACSDKSKHEKKKKKKKKTTIERNMSSGAICIA
jgi:hypothetical protein